MRWFDARRGWRWRDRALLVASGLVALVGGARAEGPGRPREVPVELGTVKWIRDFPAAQRRAAALGRPLLVVFQEVPGCATCRNFGREVLSNPLVVEAAEDLFVPVAVLNNRRGPDLEVLQRFGEPAWNNPVVRVMSHHGEDLAPRLAGLYTVASVAGRMIQALEAAGVEAPEYLRLLIAGRVERACFAMPCFWTGEAALGGMDGVRRTRTGWRGNREVVEVDFDPDHLPYSSLVSAAEKAGVAERVLVRDAAQRTAAQAVVGARAEALVGGFRATPGDDKYRLRGSAWSRLPMSEVQASRVNALVASGRDPAPLLSPRQLRLLERIRRTPDAGWPTVLGVELAAAWKAALEAAGEG